MLRSARFIAGAVLLGASVALAQQDASNREGQPPKQPEVKRLGIGDRAPELAIQTWVKGDPITGFEKGRVYVVEFWATWCGPCIDGMPHLSKLQKTYKDKGVTIIGVNIWDDPKNVEPFMKNRGDKPSGDSLMGYTVAIEKKDNPDDIRRGIMARTWMAAAEQNGIPTAFIVDQNGTIAWIGHPMRMDEPLEKVVAGTWDARKYAEEFRQQQEAQAQARQAQGRLRQYTAAIAAGDIAKATEIGTELLNGAAKNNAMLLNQIAWFMIDPEANVKNPDLDLAYKAASRAVELTQSKDAAILDTLALCYFLKGDVPKAIEIQTKAVELASPELKEELQGRLDQFKKARK